MSDDQRTGVFPNGKKFDAYYAGECIFSSYNFRTSEIALEKKLGTFVDKRRKVVSSPLLDDSENSEFHINERFEFLEKSVSLVINKIQPSVVLCGGAGIGKTTTVKSVLDSWGMVDNTLLPIEEGEQHDDDSSYVMIKGYTTARNLFKTLYTHASGVVVFDDCDNIFNSQDATNILKAALDSYDKRIVTWGADRKNSTSKIPNSFSFSGGVVFISNLSTENIDPAIITRSLCIDLKMTRKEIVDRMKMISEVDKFLPEYPLNIKKEALEFIEENKDRAKDLSLRSLITITKLRNEFPGEWKRMAEYIMMEKGVT